MGKNYNYRAAWISDTHLGTRSCRAEALMHFLQHTRMETLYLVGDIIDGWSLKRFSYWPQLHGEILRKISEIAAGGTRVVYIPGNHDDFLRHFVPALVAGVELERETVHLTADGRRFLVLHGDAFDVVCTRARWLALTGSYAYRGLVGVNYVFNMLRRWLGYPYWSLSGFLKQGTKNMVNIISDFEEAVAAAARTRDADGVICGHIHCPEHRMIGDVEYCNDGDWVESCTALVEHAGGRLEILDWSRELDQVGTAARAAGDHA
ncbi:MAG TPA: UDP-2,3-diacylglucosamine diphosphatase [Gammaproteobacteria bacterium]|nr:UDP-2,3-diacylglucosamine diphosphatase [Gammaproteobacteria bacterium]